MHFGYRAGTISIGKLGKALFRREAGCIFEIENAFKMWTQGRLASHAEKEVRGRKSYKTTWHIRKISMAEHGT